MKKTYLLILGIFLLGLLCCSSVQAFNYTNFSRDVPTWFMGPYMLYIDDLLWPLIFVFVIGIVHMAGGHVVSTLGAILLTFAVFGAKKGFIDNPELSLFFSVIAVACTAALVLAMFLRRRS